ncbi:MAG: hypothetical protein AB9866_22860 [Syntrophobacteraceae bacterium]
MRYFIWVDFQYEMAALFVGAVALIMTYLAWASYPKKRVLRTREELEDRRGHEREAWHDYEKTPIAPFLIYLYAGVTAWSICYVIYVWASGSKF